MTFFWPRFPHDPDWLAVSGDPRGEPDNAALIETFPTKKRPARAGRFLLAKEVNEVLLLVVPIRVFGFLAGTLL
jgi:hypothetical protein